MNENQENQKKEEKKEKKEKEKKFIKGGFYKDGVVYSGNVDEKIYKEWKDLQ